MNSQSTQTASSTERPTNGKDFKCCDVNWLPYRTNCPSCGKRLKGSDQFLKAVQS